MSSQIGALGESSTIYSFNKLGANETVGYLSSPQEGEIVINYIGGANSFANQTHETIHATQYERGWITRSATDPTLFNFKSKDYYYSSEITAYMAQYVIAPRSLPFSRGGNVSSIQNINLKWLFGILGADGKPIYK